MLEGVRFRVWGLRFIEIVQGSGPTKFCQFRVQGEGLASGMGALT